MKSLVFLLIAVLAVITAAIIIPRSGNIHFIITDPDTLERLRGVEVVLEGDDIWRETETDSLGSVLLAGLPSGIYRVQFRFPGYKKLELKEVVVRASKTTVLDLQLERKVHGCY